MARPNETLGTSRVLQPPRVDARINCTFYGQYLVSRDF